MTAAVRFDPVRPTPTAVRQWWALSGRLVVPAVRSGEVLTSVLAPAVFTAGFYIPLKIVMSFAGTGFSSYAQYMMPLVILQASAFTAISAAMRAATDAVSGLDRRFHAMPVRPLVPVAARMSGSLLRLCIALTAALACGHLIGFRFRLDAMHTLGFLIFALCIGMVFTLGADVVGTASRSPESITQILGLPPLILGLLSTGLAPAAQFPEWIQPFVRNQPVSQFAAVLRSFAGDLGGRTPAVTLALIGPSLCWITGLIALCIPLAWRLNTRRPA
ncbi:ABC transporter permease [Nocardia inohanensis]|uniref:ABC transporter permease n=1 Tax=Nocardia inohanensis TaxID=209246 RepID=UPI000A018F09|nr:ABC transporter permease [Nocardia inohanensis]